MPKPVSKPRKMVSVKDLRDGLARNHLSVLQFFEELDRNGDGRVVLREAAQGLRKMLEDLGYRDIAPAAIPTLFAEMDKNGARARVTFLHSLGMSRSC